MIETLFDNYEDQQVTNKLLLTIERLAIYVEPLDDMQKVLQELTKALESSMLGSINKYHAPIFQAESLHDTIKSVSFNGILGQINEASSRKSSKK